MLRTRRQTQDRCNLCLGLAAVGALLVGQLLALLGIGRNLVVPQQAAPLSWMADVPCVSSFMMMLSSSTRLSEPSFDQPNLARIQMTPAVYTARDFLNASLLDEDFAHCSMARRCPWSTRLSHSFRDHLILDVVDHRQFASLIGYGFGNSYLCDKLDEILTLRNNETNSSSSSPLLTTVVVRLSCENAFQRIPGATGNQLQTLYGMRLAARAYGHVRLHISCTDTNATKDRLVLPWTTGVFPAVNPECGPQHSALLPKDDVCRDFLHFPLGYLLEDIRYDLRRMALALVGPSQAADVVKSSSPPQKSPHGGRLWLSPTTTTPPLLANVILDQAVIHFRCGDLMGGRGHKAYSFYSFVSLTKYLPTTGLTSIGILTQPFEQCKNSRLLDTSGPAPVRCRFVVEAFCDYLRERYPQATVTIHNGPGESVALAYSRMILADFVVATGTTFPVFAVLASYGRGIFLVPVHEGAPTKFLLERPRVDRLVDNLLLEQDEPFLLSTDMVRLWNKSPNGTEVLAWFRGQANNVSDPRTRRAQRPVDVVR